MKMRVTSIGAMAVVVIVLAGTFSLGVAHAAGSNGTFVTDDFTYRHGYLTKHSREYRNAGVSEQNVKPENQQQKALDQMQTAEDTITQAEDLIESLECDVPNNTSVLLEEAKEHLVNAREAYDDENYGGAYGLANAAEMLARNAIRNLDDMCPYADEEDDEIIDEEENETIDESTDDDNFAPVVSVSGESSSSESTTDEASDSEQPAANVETPSSPEPEAPSVPPTSDEETSMLTIWYILVPNDRGPTCGDPWIHTYIVNTSGTTLYDVDFKQIIPSDLQLYNSYNYPQVRRYTEENVVGPSSNTYSYSYTQPSTYAYVYSDYTYTQTITVLGDTRTTTYTYTYTDGRVYTNSYTYPNPYTYSNSYTVTWLENEETKTYDSGYPYTSVNTTGREGTSRVAYTYTYTYTQSGANIIVEYDYEYNYNNDYIQRSYTIGGYSSDKTSMSVSQLGPMDAIYSLIRVAPVGEIDPNKDYYVTTQVSFSSEDGESYAVVDNATWREPYSSFTAIGAPYIGTTTFDRYQLWGYTSMFRYPVTGGYSSADEIVEPIDSSPPAEFDLSAPADGTLTSDNTPELSWNPSSDADPGIDNYELYVDNSLNKVITDTTQTSENTSELALGAHTWYVAAVDYAGNERRSTSTWTINIENSVLISDNLMDNYAVDNSLEENTLVQENTTADNLNTENSVADDIGTVDNSTSENTLIQGASDNSTTTDNVTTTQDNTSDNSTTSDNVVVQDNTADSSTTADSTATTDTTSSSDTSGSSTTTDSTADTSSTEVTTSSTTDTSGTGDATTDTSTTEETTTTASPGNSAWGHSHNPNRG